MSAPEGRIDPVVGCGLTLLASPFLLLAWIGRLPGRIRRNRIVARGSLACPHCHADVPTEGRATCPACDMTSFGSLLSCPNPDCTWQTHALACPTCECTVFVSRS